MLLPPGWYADPSARHAERFHDGARWTAHVRDGDRHDVDQPDDGAPPPAPEPAPAVPVPTAPAAAAPAAPVPAAAVPAEPSTAPSGVGRVVLLSGPSSSGKTTLAALLVEALDGPWFHVPVDAIGAMRSTSAVVDDEVLRRTRLGYHRVLAALVAAGNDVVADYPLTEPWRLDDLVRVLRGVRVDLVDVRCAPEELERRELARGDRPPGLAASQLAAVLPDRDLVVDTTTTAPEQCVQLVVDHLAAAPASTALDRLRAASAPARA